MPQDAPEQPQIYLVTPPAFEIETFAPKLSAVLDAQDIACLRLAHASADADEVARAADALREIAHARDVPLVIERHIGLVERLGLDGVHLADGARSVRKARKDLGPEAILGAFCGASRHDGMTAGEIGADYVAFGPVGDSPLGDGTRAEPRAFRLVVADDRASGGRRRRAERGAGRKPRPGHRFLRHRRGDLGRRRSRRRPRRPYRAASLNPLRTAASQAAASALRSG